MATPTLANSHIPQQLLAKIVRPFVEPTPPNLRTEFLVFPTGRTDYPWRIVALVTNRTISCHKSLTLALRKCARLNERGGEGVRNGTN